jgi:hypothetical protein
MTPEAILDSSLEHITGMQEKSSKFSIFYGHISCAMWLLFLPHVAKGVRHLLIKTGHSDMWQQGRFYARNSASIHHRYCRPAYF